MLAALFLIQTEDRLGAGELVFSRADLAALGSGLRVTNPIFTGATESEDRFRFTAEVVVPDAAPPTRAAITAPAGELDCGGGPTIDGRRRHRRARHRGELLTLTGGGAHRPARTATA